MDGGILLEDGIQRWRHHRRRRNRRGSAAKAVGDPLEAPKNPELTAEGDSLCTMELEPAGPAVRLSITHTIERESSKLIAAVSGGWPKIISNLKSLLETGSIVLNDSGKK
jgi:hypothetical protein